MKLIEIEKYVFYFYGNKAFAEIYYKHITSYDSWLVDPLSRKRI